MRAAALIKLLHREMYDVVEYLEYLLEADLSRKSMVTRSAKIVIVNYNYNYNKINL